MARVSLEDVLALIISLIEGEYITHNELVAALENDGKGSYTMYLPRLVKAGQLVSRVVAMPGDAPAELRYSLGGE